MKTMQVCIGFAENPEYLVKQVGLVELGILLSTVKATVFNPSLKHTKDSWKLGITNEQIGRKYP